MAGDANYTSRSLGLHFNGANNSTTFVDNSPRPKTPTVYGNAKISTAQSVFNGSSGYFDGSGSYLQYSNHADFRLGGGDFTIRGKVRFAGYPVNNGGHYTSQLIGKDQGGSASREFQFYVDGTATSLTTLVFRGFSTNAVFTTVNSAFTFSLNIWYDIEVVRSGSLVYLFVDGTLLNPGGTAFSETLQPTTIPLRVAAAEYDATYKYYLNGYMAEWTVQKGVALHTASFTPPSAPFPNSIGEVAGVVRDASGTLCSRQVRLIRRDTGAVIASGLSDATTGAYLFETTSLDEVVRIVHSNTTAAPLENDIIDRVIPA